MGTPIFVNPEIEEYPQKRKTLLWGLAVGVLRLLTVTCPEVKVQEL